MSISICDALFSGLQVLILTPAGLQIRLNGEYCIVLLVLELYCTAPCGCCAKAAMAIVEKTTTIYP